LPPDDLASVVVGAHNAKFETTKKSANGVEEEPIMGRRANDRGRTEARYRTPRVEIFETGKAVELRAEMPGVEKDNFNIGIDGNELTIRGKRTAHPDGLKELHREIDTADYLRAFTVGDELDTSKVEAQVANGVLTLLISKKPEVLPKKIEVKVE
jgi:HSP20 family molecular chaperone IbpA